MSLGHNLEMNPRNLAILPNFSFVNSEGNDLVHEKKANNRTVRKVKENSRA